MKEPVNGLFEDCTKEMLPGVKTEISSDKEDQNIIAQNDCYKPVCNGNKVYVLITDIM